MREESADEAVAVDVPPLSRDPLSRDPARLLAFARSLAGLGDRTKILAAGIRGARELLGRDVLDISVAFDQRGEPGGGNGLLVAELGKSDETPHIRNMPIEGRRAIERVLSREQPQLEPLEDESFFGLFDALDRDDTQGAHVMTLPIVTQHGSTGVLCICTAGGLSLTEVQQSWAEAAAQAFALALDTVVRPRASEYPPGISALDESEAATITELSRYLAFFESSRDAMLVMDLSGKVLFANPVAAHLTGYASGRLVGRRFEELIDSSAGALAQDVVAAFSLGKYPVGVDLPLRQRTDDGTVVKRRLVSVNFSCVMRETNAVLAAIRDVTEDRALARELSQTRDFLQRVIESSVDGIISADMRGSILVYNQAAARIFGHPKEEVIGEMNVIDLYPPGVARDVMKRIRGKEYGGRGRLSEYRVDMQTREGDRVPVSLSASLVMNGRRPVGTVGIFTDVRDKLAMEARLTRAQRELQNHEKQAAIAELAGAAAHELNQPLTAVMGYAEYLKRTLSETDPSQTRAVEVILSETERMANIVRKVGRITRYETKPYVGGAKIVDIEASSVSDE